jgi:hypothetical protein
MSKVPTPARGRPRKLPENKRSASLTIRLTPRELANLRANALAARLEAVNFIVARCCGDE